MAFIDTGNKTSEDGQLVLILDSDEENVGFGALHDMLLYVYRP